MTGPTPLAGWRVLVPRPADRAADLVGALTAAGAAPEVVELISIQPPADAGALDLAVLALSRGDYAWVAFTSVNAVDSVVSRAAALAVAPVPADTRVAAVGPTTAAAVRRAGLRVDLVPPARGSAAALAAVFPHASAADPRPESVLLPRSDLAPDLLPDELTGKGYRVDSVVAYRTVVTPPSPAVAHRLAAGDVDAVLLTSPSTVRALAGLPIAGRTALGAIGRPTRSAAVDSGREIAFVATEPSSPGLVSALIAYAHSIRSIQES
ncbi:uroporphyrinogen-III synthase [Nakamurella sp.]|uniref:uroporphyrinogen-III synthase n=1 Tax=Nakamurella sp. TaxID=1869182 RepID=UPI0037846324